MLSRDLSNSLIFLESIISVSFKDSTMKERQMKYYSLKNACFFSLFFVILYLIQRRLAINHNSMRKYRKTIPDLDIASTQHSVTNIVIDSTCYMLKVH